MKISVSHKNLDEDFEVVERKGLGHPDTLADMLAENLSCRYSEYTLGKFGAVLHHNFDKLGLLGGASYVAFGEGYMTKPIKVLVNGRASVSFAGKKIPITELILKWVHEFFAKNLPLINPERDLDVHFNLSSQSSPGKTYEAESKKSARQRWFEPEGLEDLPYLKKLVANDTSLGVGYYPSTLLEELTIEIEKALSSQKFREANKWMGTDIKVMSFRNFTHHAFTICIPQVADYVENIGNYKRNLHEVKVLVDSLLTSYDINDYEVNFNTRDNYKTKELYLTATGSSIESGDEGLAGRGNRVNGLITPTKPMSMEGASGKNPVYHVGKIYYIAAFELSKEIFDKFKIQNQVYLIGQSGEKLIEPWIVHIALSGGKNIDKDVTDFVAEKLRNIDDITPDIIKGKLKPY